MQLVALAPARNIHLGNAISSSVISLDVKFFLFICCCLFVVVAASRMENEQVNKTECVWHGDAIMQFYTIKHSHRNELSIKEVGAQIEIIQC